MGKFFKESDDDDDGVLNPDSTVFWPESKGYTYVYSNEDIRSFKRGVNWVNGKLWITYPARLIGYYYGDKDSRLYSSTRSKKRPDRGNAVGALAAIIAYLLAWYYGIVQATWIAQGAPAPFANHVNRIWTDDWPIETPTWIWLDSPGGNRNGLVTGIRSGRDLFTLLWTPAWD